MGFEAPLRSKSSSAGARWADASYRVKAAAKAATGHQLKSAALDEKQWCRFAWKGALSAATLALLALSEAGIGVICCRPFP
jgi:aldehyde:ferredoxin oxidoreductase